MQTTRRSLLKTGALAAVGTIAGLGCRQAVAPRPNGTVRVILFTDAHIGDREQADKTARAIDLAEQRNPDVVVWGGDNVMNVDSNKSFEVAKEQFDLWKEVVDAHAKSLHRAVIGNHDIWWASADHPQAALRDKAFAIQTFDIPGRYYAFEVGDWRFLMLDVFHREGCLVDAEQLEWMEQMISGWQGPVCLVSHAPILTACHFMEPDTLQDGGQGWRVPADWQVNNCKDLIQRLWKYPNVKLSLSGHMHQVDRVQFHNVDYVCGGAVSGAWWNGVYLGFGPAWVELELNRDGIARWETVYWEKLPVSQAVRTLTTA